MRVFNPTLRPYLCPALQETLTPFSTREVASEYEQRVRDCPFGDDCRCEKLDDDVRSLTQVVDLKDVEEEASPSADVEEET